MCNKHAYLIMTHADEYLLRVLIGMLDDERNDIYIHVDKKWRDFDSSRFETQKAGLYILPERIDGCWGHSSLMDIEYLLYEKAYEQGVYSYYHLLSGSDLPIKTQDYIHQFFSERPVKPYVSYWTFGGSPDDVYYKVSRYFYWMRAEQKSQNNKYVNMIFAKIHHFLADVIYVLKGDRQGSKDFYKGANWSSLPHECVQLLLARKEEMQKRMRFTRNGEEIFVQTILDQDYFTPRSIQVKHLIEDLRYVNWMNSSQSPDIFIMADRDKLLSSNKLFARKFSSYTDKSIINLIRDTYSVVN